MQVLVMRSQKTYCRPYPLIVALLLIAVLQDYTFAEGAGWERKDVNWRVSKDRQIKAIYYPADQNLPLLETRTGRKPVHLQQRISVPQSVQTFSATAQNTKTTVFENVIESPPIDGFVPYVTVAATDASSGEIYDVDAYTEYSVTGDYLTGSPQTDYAIGIFDTGSSAHIINAADAGIMGIYDADLVTSFTVTILGATGQVDALVSQPLGIFTDGLSAINPDTLLADDSNMVGQSNVATIVGDIIESPNLSTVVGSPLAFFFTTVIKNSQPVTRSFDDNEITSPDIHLYQFNDSRIPAYTNKINLELRPSTAYAVQFMPCFEGLGEECPEGDGEPTTPSVVFGSMFDVPQSLFFATRTDLRQGSRTSQQKHFMLDTGAQITVVSESQAAEIELFQNEPNFMVEIVDATGQSTIVDGFYVDSLEISAIPSYLSFTHVPVIVLDVNSPEGGVLDGILGTNLFIDTDFYINGGSLQNPPYIKFAFLPAGIAGDIAPAGGDGRVNILDLAALAKTWLSNPLSSNWNSQADLAPDAIIDFQDFAFLAQNWGQ
jgi:hypothetical protein